MNARRRIPLPLSAILIAGLLFGCKPAQPPLVPTGRVAATQPATEAAIPDEPAADWPLIEEAADLATEAEAARFAAGFAAEAGLGASDIRLERAGGRRFTLTDEAGETARLIEVTGFCLYSAGADASLGEAALLFTVAADMGPESGGEAILTVWRGGADELPEELLLDYEEYELWESGRP